jgi:hypothetical protein
MAGVFRVKEDVWYWFEVVIDYPPAERCRH